MGKATLKTRAKNGNSCSPADVALLLDFYGALLTEKQVEILDFYYNEDYSLSEIASGLNISRQAAHDAIRNGALALAEYEGKLGMVSSYQRELMYAEDVRESLDELRKTISKMREISAEAKTPDLCSQIDKLVAIACRIDKIVTRE
jgi:predicted DNA-binding protein YlxM (UPF0122 family)